MALNSVAFAIMTINLDTGAWVIHPWDWASEASKLRQKPDGTWVMTDKTGITVGGEPVKKSVAGERPYVGAMWTPAGYGGVQFNYVSCSTAYSRAAPRHLSL